MGGGLDVLEPIVASSVGLLPSMVGFCLITVKTENIEN